MRKVENTRNSSRFQRRIAAPWLVMAVASLSVGLWRRLNADGIRWYQLVYRLIYRLGLIIWRRATPPDELVALVEGPNALPVGRALDLGCGTGTDAIYLATHGWDVTGVDMVPKALAIARRNATTVGLTPRLVEGDVTQLDDLGVGDGYTLLLDFGCFHTLPEDRRTAYVTSLSHVAAPGATLLMYGFRQPPKAAPMHAGMTVDEVRQRFCSAGWELVSADQTSIKPTAIRRADALFELWRYQLHRTSD